MASNVLVALDIGTQTVSLVAAEMADGQLTELQRVSMPTAGVKKGTIRHIDNVASCVRSLREQMHSRYDIEVYDVVVNVSCAEIATQVHTGRKSLLTGHEIDEYDIEEAEQNAWTDPSPETQTEVVHRFKQNYGVNGQPVIIPNGMTGTELTANILELTAPRSVLDAIRSVLHKAGLRAVPAGIVFSGMAAAEAVLDRQRSDEGSIVIDFGAGTVDYLAICNGVVAAAGTLGIGGAHLTNDLAYAFHVSQQQAEKMKIDKGAALIQPELASDRYVLHSSFSTGDRSVSVHAIQTVTTERVDETFRLIRDILADRDILSCVHGNIYLTGGTAALPMIAERAKAVFALPCVLGVPTGVAHMPEDMMDEPFRFATAVGLLKVRQRQLNEEGVRKPSVWSRVKTFFKG